MKPKTDAAVLHLKRRLSGTGFASVVVASAIVASLMLTRAVWPVLGGAARNLQENADASTRFNWDVRTAVSVGSANERHIVLNCRDGVPVTYNFDPEAKTVSRTKGAKITTILTGVDSATFSLYRRPSLHNELLPATRENARVVGLK